MTKTAKTAPAAGYVDQIKETIESVQAKMEVPTAAREFVQRNAASAIERAQSVHSGARAAADRAEQLATSFVGGYAGITRSLLDATLANVEHTLATVEKVAGAKSVSEAVQIQADFVRENAKANFERAKDAAETVRAKVMDGASALREEISGLYGKKAA